YVHDETNQRVWNVLSRDPLFEDLAFHRIAVDYVKAVLGWPALLGNISANITGPGGGEMVLHADQIFVPEPWSSAPQGINVAWCPRPIYRTQENWFLALKPEIRQFASEEALVLLGYKTQGLGLVNGASPA